MIRDAACQAPRAFRYQLFLENRRIRRLESEGSEVRSFVKPLTTRGLPKLYVVKDDSRVIYVGYTVQPIANRIRFGLQAEGRHGYHGYAWKDLPQLGLTVWCFPEDAPERVEAIEAELVYLIRRRTGQWPESQTEIHFHQVGPDDKELARRLFDSLQLGEEGAAAGGTASATVGRRSLVKRSRRYQNRAFLYWWDITPQRAAELRSYEAVELVRKDTGERCSLPPEALSGFLTSDRQTGRGEGNWGIRVLKNHPEQLAFEPGRRGGQWLFLPVVWSGERKR